MNILLATDGSHGHGSVKRLWLGSVSLAIATSAPCSVEIVRCAAADEQSQPAGSAD